MPSEFFTDDELRCKCGCGAVKMVDWFLPKIDQLRRACNFPLPATSGYRCSRHPEEARKAAARAARGLKPLVGSHQQGLAIDIQVSGAEARSVVAHAIALGFTGIGVQQRSDIAMNRRFIHVDCASPSPEAPRPHIWSY